MPRPLNRTDFSGGMNVIASPWHLRENEVLRAINYILDEDGGLATRDGSQTVEMAPEGVTSVRSLGLFQQTDGTDVPLAITLGSAGQQLMRRDSGGWVVLGTFTTQFEIPEILPWLNVGICVPGYETPVVTDGTSFTAFTGVDIIPGAKHMAVHQNALWAWNTAEATSTYDGKSSLRQSDVEDYNSWPTSNQLFLSKDDGQEGMGLIPFTVADTGIAPQDFLVAFKNRSGYTISGTFGGGSAPTFTRIKSNMGCIAARSIEFVLGQDFIGILRLTHRGFGLFNGLGDSLISERIRPYIFGHDDIPGLTWSAIGQSVATQVQNPPLYLCACPVVPNGSLTRVFVYDLIRKAWTICTFPIPFATINLLFDSTTTPTVLAGESGGRRVVKLFDGYGTDDGEEVETTLRLPPLGEPLRRLYFRRLLLKLYRIAARTAISASFVTGPAASKHLGARVTRTSVAANAVAGSPFIDSAEATATLDVGMTGEGLYSEIAVTGMHAIRGVSVHYEAKPLMRPVKA